MAAEADGVLLKIVAQEGADVPVKGLLGYIGQPGEQVGPPPCRGTCRPGCEAAAAPSGPGTVLVIGGGPAAMWRHPGGPAGPR